MKKVKVLLTTLLTTAACFALMSVSTKAAPFENEKFSFAQPDNTKVEVIGTGDEYYQHIESPDGYTLIRNSDNWICYADLNEDGTELLATDAIYTGSSDNVPEGLEKHLDITQESVDKKIKEAKEELDPKEEQGKKSSPLLKLQSKSVDDYKFSTKTEVTGLTIMVDFKDVKSKFSVGDVEDFMNKEGYSEFGNNGSVHDYFYDISNGMLDYTNKVIRVQVSGNKEDYDNSKEDNGSCAEKIIDEVEKLVSDNDLQGITKKSDGSFRIINILYAGSIGSGWSKGLWPHKSSTTFKGKSQVYQITDLGSQLSIGTICHETGHALLNYPDLYSYYTLEGEKKSGPSIVGGYCIMGNSGGKNPAPPNPYLRYIVSGFKGNIFDLNSINDGTELSLKSDTKGNGDVYKWTNPNKENEYFLLENIQEGGRYTNLSNYGLIVWHIDEDETNKDVRTKKYKVSIIDAVNPNKYIGEKLFGSETKDVINRVDTPNASWNNGAYSELKISNISDSKDVMTFKKGSYIKPGLYNKYGNIFYITNELGETFKGFKEIDSNMYYFDEVTGNAYKGVTEVSENGEKYKCYFDKETGVMQRKLGLFTVGDDIYYVKNNKWELAEGFNEIGSNIYYFDKKNRNAYKGYCNIYSEEENCYKWYYFDKKTGIMQKGLVKDGEDVYYCDEITGESKRGYWLEKDGKKYYFGYDGKAYKGLNWLWETDKVYYFDENGAYDPSKNEVIVEGDYKVIDSDDYFTACKNHVTLGEKIPFRTAVVGEDYKNFTYKYKTYYKAVAAPAEEFEIEDKERGLSNFEFIPKNTGYCLIEVTATNKKSGETYINSVMVEVHPKLEVTKFQINNEEIEYKKGGVAAEIDKEKEVSIKLIDEGGYAYGDKKYTFEILKDGGDENKDKEVYTSTSPELKWTPKDCTVYGYSIEVTVEDPIGNKVEGDLYLYF